MRPAPLLIRLTILLAFAALLATVVPVMAWVVAGAFAILLIAAAIEALALRRIRFEVERQLKLALPLHEHEEVTVRIMATGRHSLRMTVRQRWPEIVEPRSSVADAVCGAGEVLTLPFTIRGIARGTA